MATQSKYEVLGANIADPSWDGSPKTLAVDSSLVIPQTPNGAMVFAYENKSTGNNDGTLLITSGASDPLDLDSPFGIPTPKILIKNWQANNFNLTNASAHADTPIWVEAAGPGLSPKPGALIVGTPVDLKPYEAVQGTTAPRYMQLKMMAGSGDTTVIAVIGGLPDPKTGSNAYVYALNWPNSGPTPAEMGYTQGTTSNSITKQFNWGAAVVWIANLSPSTARKATVLLRSL
jgi:hypothetical protein